MTVAQKNALKCVIVGNGNIGKRCCIFSYTTNTFPSNGTPQLWDSPEVNIDVDGSVAKMRIFDTFGGDAMDGLRPLIYPYTDVFLIGFDITSPQSFHQVRVKWKPEVKLFDPNIPILLVGMRCDLRKDEETMKQLAEEGKSMVTEEEARKCAQEIGAKGYYECSALTQEGLKPLFEDAIRTARVKQAFEPKKKKTCTIL